MKSRVSLLLFTLFLVYLSFSIPLNTEKVEIPNLSNTRLTFIQIYNDVVWFGWSDNYGREQETKLPKNRFFFLILGKDYEIEED